MLYYCLYIKYLIVLHCNLNIFFKETFSGIKMTANRDSLEGMLDGLIEVSVYMVYFSEEHLY